LYKHETDADYHVVLSDGTRTMIVLDVLDAHELPDRVVMHCFSGDADFARRSVERGFRLSYPGVITYNANAHLREALAATPREKVLVETDAPYLTPVPARGKPNASYLVAHTVRFVADQRGWDLGEACQQLTRQHVRGVRRAVGRRRQRQDHGPPRAGG